MVMDRIDLRGKPFYLGDEAVRWVEETLQGMTDKEKVGQLFCEILWDRPGCSPEALLEDTEPGGVMYRPFSGEKMREYTERMQKKAKIPLLIACNLERGGSGGNGGLTDGTYVSSPMGCAATDDAQSAYKLAEVACKEGGAAGVNWTFEPIVDIDLNPGNPITNVRTYGSSPERIIRMAKGYMEACRRYGVISTVKHFPGDGVDERDQHLMSSINSLPAQEWYESYGRIYQELIDDGAPAVMCAHIKQPALCREVDPGIKDEDIMPASLSRELMQGILREKLGFNGLIVTDATQMVGFTCSMPRHLAVPAAIERGADMERRRGLYDGRVKERAFEPETIRRSGDAHPGIESARRTWEEAGNTVEGGTFLSAVPGTSGGGQGNCGAQHYACKRQGAMSSFVSGKNAEGEADTDYERETSCRRAFAGNRTA